MRLRGSSNFVGVASVSFLNLLKTPACNRLVSRVSSIFLYFRWEEREGEKNTSGHSDQLPVPRRNVIIAAGHAHGMQIKTFIPYLLLFCEACAHTGKLS